MLDLRRALNVNVQQQIFFFPLGLAKELGLRVPLVVRLEGTNVELGRKILNESGLAIQAASTMADGAQKVVAAVERASAGGGR